MKCNGLRVVASRLVDAMPVYARFMPLFVEKKNSRQKGGSPDPNYREEEEEEESHLINLKR